MEANAERQEISPLVRGEGRIAHHPKSPTHGEGENAADQTKSERQV
jgi:hypothetical protein